MRYTKKTSAGELRKNYKYLIGWGAGRDEFYKRYNPHMYQLDFMIDGSDDLKGQTKCGMIINCKSILENLKNEKNICFIIFPNLEFEIIEQIQEYMKEFDTIIARLVDCGHSSPLISRYADTNEDLIFQSAMNKLGILNPYYVDIGVCHPVIRNNTYLLYENGNADGLLVEPNSIMCELAEVYRPKNKIIRAGACAGADKTLNYYVHPVASCRGHNTFNYDVAKEGGFEDNFIEIPVMNINQILEQNCERIPDILDIDTEGMDIELINELDTEKFPIKLICVEEWGKEKEFADLMSKKGYVNYMNTAENTIYISEKLMVDFKG